jgi:acyl-CoA synthetase (AMP-forming)/AMP-acid ligase II
LGTIAPPYAPANETRASGRPVMGFDLLLTDADGTALPQQRGAVGHLKVKGASVLDRYFKAESGALDAGGYFDTGDLASIDGAGNLTISGRSKDLIKSGGEWINPAEIEDLAGRHPAVGLAAVIARPHAKWGERPVLIVQMRQGRSVGAEVLREFLRGKIAGWWMPDQILAIDHMPLAATGKIDKNQLRADYANGNISAEGGNG